MSRLAIIGGTGLTTLQGLEISSREMVHTPWGEPSGPVVHGMLNGVKISFLPRHGHHHTIAPHKVNYRANVWALKEVGVKRVIAVAAVGAIHSELMETTLAIPDQIIDYTWGRAHTFFEDQLKEVVHVDFSYPYDAQLRGCLIDAAKKTGVQTYIGGTYGATQGPRLETSAEINRMEGDGCHMVGMTGMPEAVLARELGLAYAHCAVITNAAAGRGDGTITLQGIEAHLKVSMAQVKLLLEELVNRDAAIASPE